jgi:hypothetical protein
MRWRYESIFAGIFQRLLGAENLFLPYARDLRLALRIRKKGRAFNGECCFYSAAIQPSPPVDQFLNNRPALSYRPASSYFISRISYSVFHADLVPFSRFNHVSITFQSRFNRVSIAFQSRFNPHHHRHHHLDNHSIAQSYIRLILTGLPFMHKVQFMRHWSPILRSVL